MTNPLKRLLPAPLKRSIKYRLGSFIETVNPHADHKKVRAEIDLLHYRIDELMTQVARLSAHIHAENPDANRRINDSAE